MPLQLGIRAAEMVKSGVQTAANVVRVGYEEKEIVVAPDAANPDVYVQCGLHFCDNYTVYESKVIRNTTNPVWKSGRMDETPNTFRFFVPENASPNGVVPCVYFHVYDNVLGGEDVYLGEVKFPVTALDPDNTQVRHCPSSWKSTHYTRASQCNAMHVN